MANVRFSCSPNVRFTKYDMLALCLAIFIPVTAIVLTMVAVLPSLGAPPLPNFEDPTKGFEPRGTELSNHIVTYENFVKALQNTTQLRTSLGAQENGTSQENNVNTVARKRRSVQSSLQPPLYSVVSDSMVFVFKSSADPEENLFEASKLKTVCAMDSGIVRSSPSFESQCYNFNDGSKTQCYASWSLGNYVALLNNRVSCQDVTDEDVLKVKNLLQNCSSYFVKQTLKADCEYPDTSKNETVSSNCPSVPARCIKYSAVYNIFQYLVDNQFMGTPDDALLKYTLTMLPVPHDLKSFYDEMYNRLKDSIHVRDGVELATFRFWRYKYKKFSEELFVEIIFPALALLVVFCVMWFYLGSFILTFCGLFCIIYASGLSYFLYNIVFGMDFFPFLNVLTLVFLVGIGADDAFVYCDIWRQTRAANPNANIMQLTLKTLRYSALSMLVTSLTTASAFFAGVSSTITAIKCFGIFAGTSILTNYLLMITYFPAVVALHEKWVMKYSEGRSLDVPTSIELAAEKTGAEVAAPIAQDMSESREASNGDHNTQEESGSHKTQKKTSFCILQIIDFPCSLAVSALGVTQRFSSKVFGRWLPIIVIKFHWIWITLLVCLTAGFLCVNFVKPGLQLPESDEFQTFASSHTLENYNLNYKSFFRFEQDGTMSVELIWGIKPADNGNFLDPDNKGSLEFDESFGDLFTKDGQKFLRSLCTSVEKQSFFAAFVGNVGCPIEGLITACTSGPNPCCGKNATFPFPPDVTEKCLLAFASTGQDSGVLFDAESGKIKGFRMVIYTKQSFTTAFSIIDELFKEVDSWVKTEMPKAPPGLRNGWAGSWGFNFYGLQIGLSQGTYSSLGISVAVSFIVMLLTTLNIFISIYAIITIIGIIAITIGSLVLAGWQLNILESIVMSVAVGLSIDFTMHYGVAYRLAPDKSRRENRVRYSLVHIGSAITMAALTTFLTGLMMMPATVLVYFQLGQFLMLVMVFSWFYSTFSFLSICSVIGPKENFGQLSISRLLTQCGLCLCRVKPEGPKKPAEDNELGIVNEHVDPDVVHEDDERGIVNKDDERGIVNERDAELDVNEDAKTGIVNEDVDPDVGNENAEPGIVNERDAELDVNKDAEIVIVNKDGELGIVNEHVDPDVGNENAEPGIVNEKDAKLDVNKEDEIGIVNEIAVSKNGINTPL